MIAVTKIQGAGELPVDVNRAAAHALQHARFFQRPARKTAQNQGLLRSDVLQNPQNFDLEFLDTVAGKHRLADAPHTGFEVLQRKEYSLGRGCRSQREGRGDYCAEHNPIVPEQTYGPGRTIAQC
jgi:hypothetical protein